MTTRYSNSGSRNKKTVPFVSALSIYSIIYVNDDTHVYLDKSTKLISVFTQVTRLRNYIKNLGLEERDPNCPDISVRAKKMNFNDVSILDGGDPNTPSVP